MSRLWRSLLLAVGMAAILWFYMFSPWTRGWPNFWVVMSFSAVLLTTIGIAFTPDRKKLAKIEKPAMQLLGGVALAFILWGIFWVGDKASSWLFDFARPEVDVSFRSSTGLGVFTTQRT